MRFFNRILFYSITVVSLFSIGFLFANDQQKFKHPGQVVDMTTGQPVSVDVKAWPKSNATGYSGECPLYGESTLDSTISSANTGNFELNIDASKPTYTTTYCANGYVPRAERDNRNMVNESPVKPNPVGVLKREVDQKTFNLIVRDKTISVFSDLSYLRKSDPKRFYKAMNAVAEEVGSVNPDLYKTMFEFKSLIERWN